MGVYEHPDQCNMYFVCTSEGRVRDEHIDECSESSNTLHIYLYVSTNSFPGIPTHLCRGHPFQCGHRGMHVWGTTILLHSFYLLIIGGGGLQGAKREASYRIKRKEQWNKNLIVPPCSLLGNPDKSSYINWKMLTQIQVNKSYRWGRLLYIIFPTNIANFEIWLSKLTISTIQYSFVFIIINYNIK